MNTLITLWQHDALYLSLTQTVMEGRSYTYRRAVVLAPEVNEATPQVEV